MHRDHWSNLQLCSTANLDYGTNHTSWNKAFRGRLEQYKLPGEPSQAHPLPRSLQMCSTWYFQTKRNRRNCSVWDGYEKTPLMLLPSAISSPRNWGERVGAMWQVYKQVSVTCKHSSMNVLSTPISAALTAHLHSHPSSCYTVHTGTAEIQLF